MTNVWVAYHIDIGIKENKLYHSDSWDDMDGYLYRIGLFEVKNKSE
jgi:hypothetical protein